VRINSRRLLWLVCVGALAGCTTKYVPTDRAAGYEYKVEASSATLKRKPAVGVKCTRRIAPAPGQKVGYRRGLSTWGWVGNVGGALGLSALGGLMWSQGRVAMGQYSIGVAAAAPVVAALVAYKRGTVDAGKVRADFEPAPGERIVAQSADRAFTKEYVAGRNGVVVIPLSDFPRLKQSRGTAELWVYSKSSPVTRAGVTVGDNGVLGATQPPERFPPALSFAATFDDSTGDRDLALDGDESGRIVLTVANSGKGIANDIQAKLTSARVIPGLRVPATYPVGDLKLSERKRVVVPVSANRSLPTDTVELKVELLEPYFQADATPVLLRFEARQFEPPDLVVHEKGVAEGEVVPGKSAEVSFVVLNRGKGKADEVECQVHTPTGVRYLGNEDVFDLGSLEPGAWKRLDFPIFVGARFEAESLRLTASVREARPEFCKDIGLHFPLNRPVERLEQVSIAPVDTGLAQGRRPLSLVADVDTGIPTAVMRNPDAVAVVVAVRDYTKVPTAEYALRDASLIQVYLVKALGYDAKNVIFLQNPSKADLEGVFGIKGKPQGQLYNYVRKDESDVFVYYAGHGAPDLKTKEAYLVPTDAQPSYIDLQGYPLSTFYENLGQVPAKSMTVVLDACFSGAYDKGMIIEQASPLPVAAVTEQPVGNMNVVTACGAGEVASWYSDKRHGLFTYWFLKGLQGEADANKDKAITVGEFRKYVSENVSYWAQRLHNRIQTPTFSGDESRVVAKLR